MDLGGKLELVERLDRLRHEGALTDEEFANAKASVLRNAKEASHASRSDKGSLLPQFAAAGPKLLALIVAVVLVAGCFYLLTSSTTNSNAVPAPEITNASTAGPQSTSAAEADAALASADAPVAVASDAVNEVGADGGLSSDSVSRPERPVERAVLSTRPARCRVHVSSHDLVGPCTYKAFSDTEFEVSSQPGDFAVQVVFEGDQVHGIIMQPNGSVTDVGALTQKGACWINPDAEVCAWAV